MATVFVSGHLDLTIGEFVEHYIPHLQAALEAGDAFVVGDAKGADQFVHSWLSSQGGQVTVYHMFEAPRYDVGSSPTRGGFTSDDERDAAMTNASDKDIAWVRPGREKSGTAKNLTRRNL